MALVIMVAAEYRGDLFAVLSTSAPKPACQIKGNISISSGRKLYHLPGMEDYEKTNIQPDHGERWFCTENEAIANGWTKAPN